MKFADSSAARSPSVRLQPTSVLVAVLHGFHVVPVTFNTTNTAQLPFWRDEYQKVIALAIEASRPLDEQWAVKIFEPGDPAIRLDFILGTDAPCSLIFLPDNDDDTHSVLYRIVSQFLRSAWPSKPS